MSDILANSKRKPSVIRVGVPVPVKPAPKVGQPVYVKPAPKVGEKVKPIVPPVRVGKNDWRTRR